MLWFSVWTVLVVGTLVGAFFLGRRLYRSGRDLLTELGRASDLIAAAAERADELAAAADGFAVPAPVDLSDREAPRIRRAVTATATERRREARAARQQDTYRRWRAFSH